MIKILVIGEECDDIFIYGKIDRLSPEAPVPVFQPIDTKINRGMSGNVVDNLLSLHSELLITHWKQSNKITKTRLVESKSNHMVVRIDEGESVPIDSLGELTDEMIKIIKEQDFVIISDYDKGYLTESNIYNICSHSKLSIVDSKKILNSETLTSISWLKLNEKEWNNNSEIQKLWSKKILKTVGEKGTWYDGNLYPSLNPKETIDVSGAGDTFVSSFILKYYLTKGDILESINYANKMASIVVSKRGVSTP
jgi:D-glycero-beta-D-manno-heptose-7-phosphate kinase